MDACAGNVTDVCKIGQELLMSVRNFSQWPVTCAILQYSAIQFSEAGSTRAKLTPQWIIIAQNWEVNIKIYTATEKSSNALWGG